MQKIEPNYEKSFEDGYVDGYQSVRGKGIRPAIPSHAIPAGYTSYQWGYEKGARDAKD